MNKILRTSQCLYRVMLTLYPLEHRQAYGNQMVQTFRDMCCDTLAKRGYSALAILWLETFSDVVVSAFVEHSALFRSGTKMSRKGLLILALVLVFGLLTGYINLNATEVQSPIACILVFSFLAGGLQPKAAWRWALLIAISIPLSYFIGGAIHYPIVDPPRSLGFDPKFLILIIPALVATYSGALFSRTVGPINRQVQ